MDRMIRGVATIEANDKQAETVMIRSDNFRAPNNRLRKFDAAEAAIRRKAT